MSLIKKKKIERIVNNIDLLVYSNYFSINEKYPFNRETGIYILEVAWEP